MLETIFQHPLVAFIIVLSVLVFVHEYGHYIVAKWNGVGIETFSIGFGPELFGFTDKHGTRWKFSAVPLGGYVKMHGDSNAASAPVAQDKDNPLIDKNKAFFHKSLGQRAAIVAAGPAMNYAFAIVVMAILFITVGQPYAPPVVQQIVPDSAAEAAGLQQGDRITAINNSSISAFSDVQRIVRLSAGETLQLTVERNGETFTQPLVPATEVLTDRLGNTHQIGLIGVQSAPSEVRKLALHTALGTAVTESWNITSDTFKALGQIIMGTRSVKELGGPVRIAQMSGEMASVGIATFVMFAAMLSVNLGLVNLLPVPALDGGHLLYYAAEAVRGKPVSERVQEVGAMAGIGLILLLMVVVTWNDVARLIPG